MFDYFTYLLYKLFYIIMTHIPKSIMKHLVKVFANIGYAVDTKHKKIAYNNLDFAYGNSISYSEKRTIVKESYENLIQNIYDFILNQNLSLEDMDKKVSIKNGSFLTNLIKTNKKIIIVTAHYGSWELAIPYVSLKFRPISVISKAIKNRYLNKVFVKVRHKHNLVMFEKHGAAKKIVKALKDNRMVAMAIDQNIGKKDATIVKFFGKEVTQTDAPIRLASKLGAKVVPMLFTRDGFDKHQAIFFEPLDVKDNCTKDDIVNYSQQISHIFENQIRKNPRDWFWQHRRFKEFHKDIYK
ncbi:Lipid A biosynthesis lauroyl acyltransferase [hydrothermal vent metagenome]|uniref:Lipid A biosynthesis lauroyl acyltransferase n=1 Tax=hydrothermal vent metagenome TaxID=652676 RepID=A0A3B1DYN6_9ZZZZ